MILLVYPVYNYRPVWIVICVLFYCEFLLVPNNQRTICIFTLVYMQDHMYMYIRNLINKLKKNQAFDISHSHMYICFFHWFSLLHYHHHFNLRLPYINQQQNRIIKSPPHHHLLMLKSLRIRNVKLQFPKRWITHQLWSVRT